MAFGISCLPGSSGSSCHSTNPLQQTIPQASVSSKRRWALLKTALASPRSGKTAATLLKTTGISLRPATDSLVQRKKREIANELEQLFPLEFGATPGIDRDYADQKGTSYALLTLAMDAAKRQSKRKVKVLSPEKPQVGRKRRFAERASPPRPRPTCAPVEKQPLASASAPESHRAPPTRQEPIPIPPKPVSTSIVVLKVPPNRPALVAAVDILLIIRGDCSGLDVYSP